MWESRLFQRKKTPSRPPTPKIPTASTLGMAVKIKVISAVDESHGHSRLIHQDGSNCFIKVCGGGQEPSTRVIKENRKPVWNEDLVLSSLGDTMEIVIQLWHQNFISILFTHKIGEVKTKLADLVEAQRTTKPVCLALLDEKGKSVGSVLVEVSETKDVDAGNLALEQAHKAVTEAGLEHAPDVPSDDTMDRLAQLADKLKSFITILDTASELHPLASVAWKVVSAVIKAINAQAALNAEVVGLVVVMDDANIFLADYKSMADLTPPFEKLVNATLKQNMECSIFIRDYCRVGFLEHAAIESFQASASGKISGFKSAYTKLQSLRLEGISTQSAIVSYRVLTKTEDILRDLLVQRLRPIKPDNKTRPTCLPGTRTDMIQELVAWAATPSPEYVSKNVYWLHGTMGSGKSTIAKTVANLFESIGRLGAYISFDRELAHTPSDVIRTIAARLAIADDRISRALQESIKNPPEGHLNVQFSKLLYQPLKDLAQPSAEGPVLIVLDALDECGNAASREELLDVLANHFPTLPKWIRLLVTSQNLTDIRNGLSDKPSILVSQIDIRSQANKADVRIYMKASLEKIRTDPKNKLLNMPPGWPGIEALETLSRRAAGLFIWASTAVAFIDAFNPPKRLESLLASDPGTLTDLEELTPEAALGVLYKTTLEEIGSWKDKDLVSNFTTVLGVVLVAHEPLSAASIDELMGQHKSVPTGHTIQFLDSVLSIAQDKPIRIIHPAFREYLTSPVRCTFKDKNGDLKTGAWCIDEAEQEKQRRFLAQECLKRVVEHLTTHHLAISLFRSRKEDKGRISVALLHAYRYGVDYVTATGDNVGEFALHIALFLDKVRFSDWCTVIGIFWSKFIALDLTFKLMLWLEKHYAELTTHASSINKQAMVQAIDILYDFIDAPPPGTSIEPAQSKAGLASTAPPKVIFNAQARALGSPSAALAMSAVAEGDVHLSRTRLSKDLIKLKSRLGDNEQGAT